MKKKIKFTITICFIPLMLVPASAGEGKYSGIRTGVFLEQPVGARAVGMGEAFVALTDDIHSLWWNPSGMGDMSRYEVMLMHDEYIQNINQEYGAFAIPLKNIPGTIGGSINYLDYGRFKRTTITSGNAGQTAGSFGANSYAATLGYGRNMGIYNVGFNLKYIHEEIDRVSGNAFGADIGLKYRINNLFVIGYALQNIGTKIKLESEQSSLPLTHRIGLGYYQPNNQLNIEVDAVKSDNDQWSVNLGGELWALRDRVAFRAGYTSSRDIDDKYTVGAGFRYKNFSLDYAFTPFSELGNSHKVSIIYRFGDAR